MTKFNVLLVLLAVKVFLIFVCNGHNIIENFKSNVCYNGPHDVTQRPMSYLNCTNECRSRSKCVAISVYMKMNLCRLHFASGYSSVACPMYIFSEKKNWLEKTIEGCESVTCQNNNQKCEVVNNTPSCSNIECPQINSLVQGTVYGNDARLGKKASFTCNPGSSLIGSSTLVCKENGEWNDTIPTCLTSSDNEQQSYYRNEDNIPDQKTTAPPTNPTTTPPNTPTYTPTIPTTTTSASTTTTSASSTTTKTPTSSTTTPTSTTTTSTGPTTTTTPTSSTTTPTSPTTTTFVSPTTTTTTSPATTQEDGKQDRGMTESRSARYEEPAEQTTTKQTNAQGPDGTADNHKPQTEPPNITWEEQKEQTTNTWKNSEGTENQYKTTPNEGTQGNTPPETTTKSIIVLYGGECDPSKICYSENNLECRLGLYRCKLGYIYDPTKNVCVTDCTETGYGDTFQTYFNKWIPTDKRDDVEQINNTVVFSGTKCFRNCEQDDKCNILRVLHLMSFH